MLCFPVHIPSNFKSLSGDLLQNRKSLWRDASIEQAPEASRQALREMAAWARQVDADGTVTLLTRQGPNRTVLNLRAKSDEAGLCALWNDSGQPYLWLHGTVILRLAPITHVKLTAMLGKDLGFRVGVRWAEVGPELLALLREGYLDAAAG